MTDKTQPEALRLAEQYDYGDPAAHSNTWKVAVCTELRRLHAENERLSGMCDKWNSECDEFREDNKRLAALVEAQQNARIAELEAQLEAIGAGGVSGPLMGRASLAASAGSEPVAPYSIDADTLGIRYALELGLLWIDGSGRDKVREALAAMDALEAKLASIGAGGVQALIAAPAGPWSLGEMTGNWRDIDLPDHGAIMRIVWKMEDDEGRNEKLEAQAHAVVAALNAASPTPPAEQQAAPKAASGEPDRADATNLARNTIKYPDLQLTAKGVHCLAEAVLEMDNYIAHFVNAAPQQEAQEPVAWQSRTRPVWGDNTRPWSPWEPCTKAQAEDYWKAPLLHDWAYEARALYTAPQPAPAPLSDDTKRLNWLLWKLPGDALRYVVGELSDTSSGAEFRAAIDAALAAQGGKA